MKKLSDYTAEQLTELALAELAYIYLSGKKSPVSFDEIAEVVFDAIGSKESMHQKLGQFYTDLTIDGRFVTFSNGKWDLRYRHPFEVYDVEEEIADEFIEEEPLALLQEEVVEEEKSINVDEIIERTTLDEEEDEF